MAFLSSTDLWELSPDGLLLVDEGGTIQAVNPALSDMVGHEPTRLVGEPVESLIPIQVRDDHIERRTAYFRDPASRAMGGVRHLEALHANGRAFPVTVTLTPLHLDGAVSVVASVRDLTDTERNSRALSRANQRRALAEDADRIATELHDNVVQRLFVLGLDLQQLSTLVESGATSERLGAAVDTIDDTIREIRNTIFDLTAPRAPSISLREEIREAVAQIGSTRGTAPDVRFDGDLGSVDVTSRDVPVRRVLERTIDLVTATSDASNVMVTIGVDDVLAIAVKATGVAPPSNDVIAGLDAVRASTPSAQLRLDHDDDTMRVVWSIDLS